MKKVIGLAVVLLVLAAASAYADCTTTTLTYVTENFPTFYIGQPAHFDLQAVGGTPPYQFTIVDGTLPAGLHLTQSGQLRGVPQEVADVTVFILLTDAQGCHLTQAFPVRTDVAP